MRACRSVIRAVLVVLACALMTVSSAFAQTLSTDPSQPPPPSAATADVLPQTPKPSLEREFFKNLLRDQRAIWTSPLHLKEGNHWRFIILGGVSTALIFTDEKTAGRLGNNTGRLNISTNVSRLGSWYGLSGVTGAFYLVGRMTGNDKARETGVLSAEALINSLIVGEALKGITERKRPLDQPGEAKFFNGGGAFPSGHSINAWAVATVVAHEYNNLPAQIGAYAAASLVSVSRFTGRRHFLSDIFIGGAMGYGIGRYVYRTHHDSALDTGADLAGGHGGKWRPVISPIFSRANREYGLSLRWGL